MKAWYFIIGAALLGTTLLIVSATMSPLTLLGPWAPLANLWPSAKGLFYHAKAEHLEHQVQAARVEATVAQHEVKQLTASAAITAQNTDAQDTHITAQRSETAKAIEVIDEHIAAAPADCLPVDDPVVRDAAVQAVRRAQRAQDRLQGTAQDGSSADGTGDVDGLARVGEGLYEGDRLGRDRLFAGSGYGGLPGQASEGGRYPMKAKIVSDRDGRFYGIQFNCPGCALLHGASGANILPVRWLPEGQVQSPHTAGKDSWTFNGDFDRPVFSPSVLSTCEWGEDERKDVCHSWVGCNGAQPGQIKFLSDCTHALAGQTVDLPDLATEEPDA